jgi:hypothetical protein
MRGAVPVLFAAQLINITVTRQVSALNPALRIPPNVSVHKTKKNEHDKKDYNNTGNYYWIKILRTN